MDDEERAKYFGTWWPAACAAKGWRVKDEVRRRHTTGECMRLVRGPQTESITALGNDEVTALKTYLLHLANPSNLVLAANWVDCQQDYRAYNRAKNADWHERKAYGSKGSKKLRKDRFAGQQHAAGETFEPFNPAAIRKRHMTMANRHKAKGYKPRKQAAGDLRFVAMVSGRAVVGAASTAPVVQPSKPAPGSDADLEANNCAW